MPEDPPRGAPQTKIRTRLGTMLVSGIALTVCLSSARAADPARPKCYALDPHGDRKQEVAIGKADGGGTRLVLGPEFQTVWYEIEIRCTVQSASAGAR
jgi:hypothetical protein